MSVTTAIIKEAAFACEYLTCLNGIVWREALRFLHQRETLCLGAGPPLVWLFIFAAASARCSASRSSRLRDLHPFTRFTSRRPDGDDPALQRHAVVALDGL